MSDRTRGTVANPVFNRVKVDMGVNTYSDRELTIQDVLTIPVHLI